MKFRPRNLLALGELLCGNPGSDEPRSDNPKYFPYRSSTYLTELFQDLDMDWVHDGSTRHRWVADVLEKMRETLAESRTELSPHAPRIKFTCNHYT